MADPVEGMVEDLNGISVITSEDRIARWLPPRDFTEMEPHQVFGEFDSIRHGALTLWAEQLSARDLRTIHDLAEAQGRSEDIEVIRLAAMTHIDGEKLGSIENEGPGFLETYPE